MVLDDTRTLRASFRKHDRLVLQQSNVAQLIVLRKLSRCSALGGLSDWRSVRCIVRLALLIVIVVVRALLAGRVVVVADRARDRSVLNVSGRRRVVLTLVAAREQHGDASAWDRQTESSARERKTDRSEGECRRVLPMGSDARGLRVFNNDCNGIAVRLSCSSLLTASCCTHWQKGGKDTWGMLSSLRSWCAIGEKGREEEKGQRRTATTENKSRLLVLVCPDFAVSVVQFLRERTQDKKDEHRHSTAATAHA